MAVEGQIVIPGAGVPGAINSYWSAKKTLVGVLSAKTLIPEIGWILVIAGANANLTIVIRITATPTYDTVSGASANSGGMFFSDGTNLFVNNADTSDRNLTYYVLGLKP